MGFWADFASSALNQPRNISNILEGIEAKCSKCSALYRHGMSDAYGYGIMCVTLHPN